MVQVFDQSSMLVQLGGPDNVAEITGRRGTLVSALCDEGVTYQARNMLVQFSFTTACLRILLIYVTWTFHFVSSAHVGCSTLGHEYGK